MANQANDQKISKPTFAKVLASSYQPPSSDLSPTTAKPPAEAVRPSPAPITINVPKDDVPVDGVENEDKSIPDTSSSHDSSSNAVTTPTSTRVEDSTSKNGNDDGSTHISSDGSAKLASFDTKSIASGTTFALDEKESIRPDDSASMRAIAEDDELVSAPGSVLAGSHVNSDLGGMAFREQLHEIANINPIRNGEVTTAGFQSKVVTNTDSTPHSQPSQPVAISNPAGQQEGQVPMTPPDEKLMEALQSPRDRVFVLKLEQDIIDFINQSKETTLALPKCNGFYRMLAHKLADYYRLDHIVDHTQAGAAVIITRTSFCRLAPPLSTIPNASAAITPMMIQARKIMRRPDDPRHSENSTAANSDGPSATPSEVGVERDYINHSPTGGSDVKPKTNMTREEREAKYAEARERIFGKDGPTDLNDAVGDPEDSHESRTSSASGKRKAVKKQRNLSNDDFEPRSQFYGASPVSNGYPTDQYYYQSFASQPGPQYTVPPNSTHPMNYMAGYSSMMPGEGQPQYGWQSPPMQMNNAAGVPPYPQNAAGGYDLPTHFNTGMQSFQTAAPAVSMPNKQPVMAPYPHPHQPQQPQQPHMSQWSHPQPSYDQGYQYRPGYPPPASSPMPTQNHYTYGQYPMSGPAASMQGKQYMAMNHPRPQFNPQIQSFVPGSVPNRPMAMQPNVSLYGMSQPMPMPMHMPMSMPTGPMTRNMSHQPTAGRPVSATTPIPQHPAPVVSSIQQDSSTTSAASASSSPPSSSANPKPVPEITAKWGTPSHLPRKPPPPESMEPHKYMEINKGLHQYPGLPRINANGFGNTNFSATNNRFGS